MDKPRQHTWETEGKWGDLQNRESKILPYAERWIPLKKAQIPKPWKSSELGDTGNLKVSKSPDEPKVRRNARLRKLGGKTFSPCPIVGSRNTDKTGKIHLLGEDFSLEKLKSQRKHL